VHRRRAPQQRSGNPSSWTTSEALRSEKGMSGSADARRGLAWELGVAQRTRANGLDQC